MTSINFESQSIQQANFNPATRFSKTVHELETNAKSFVDNAGSSASLISDETGGKCFFLTHPEKLNFQLTAVINHNSHPNQRLPNDFPDEPLTTSENHPSFPKPNQHVNLNPRTEPYHHNPHSDPRLRPFYPTDEDMRHAEEIMKQDIFSTATRGSEGVNNNNNNTTNLDQIPGPFSNLNLGPIPNYDANQHHNNNRINMYHEANWNPNRNARSGPYDAPPPYPHHIIPPPPPPHPNYPLYEGSFNTIMHPEGFQEIGNNNQRPPPQFQEISGNFNSSPIDTFKTDTKTEKKKVDFHHQWPASMPNLVNSFDRSGECLTGEEKLPPPPNERRDNMQDGIYLQNPFHDHPGENLGDKGWNSIQRNIDTNPANGNDFLLSRPFLPLPAPNGTNAPFIIFLSFYNY